MVIIFECLYAAHHACAAAKGDDRSLCLDDAGDAEAGMTTEAPYATDRLEDGDVKVLLLENIHTVGAEFLRSRGYQVETRDGALTEDELIEAIQGVHLLGIRSTTYVTERVLAAAPDLLAIGAFCIGTNQIDLPAATKRGVAVFNAPYSNTRSVVELAIAEIISLARRLHEKSTDMTVSSLIRPSALVVMKSQPLRLTSPTLVSKMSALLGSSLISRT